MELTGDLSLGEAEALITKAARGAGFPWGLAAEAGAAARRLIASGAPDAAAAFAAFLAAPPSDAAACPLRTGLYAADLGEDLATGPATDAATDAAWRDVRRAAADPSLTGPITRCVLAPETRAALEALAARTYAPATEESRRRGAG